MKYIQKYIYFFLYLKLFQSAKFLYFIFTIHLYRIVLSIQAEYNQNNISLKNTRFLNFKINFI